MLRVERGGLERFEQGRDEWNGLVDRMRRPTTFSTWEWIHAWWTHFGKPYQLLPLYVYRDQSLIGILPLASRLMRVEDAVMPGRALIYCGSKETYSDHIDVIAAEQDALECLDAVTMFLQESYRGWDVMQWSHVAEDSVMLEFARAGSAPFEITVREVSLAATIPLEGGFEAYLKTLSRGGRHNLKRARTRMHDELGAVFERCEPGQVESVIREIFDLHNLRATQKGTATAFQGEPLLRFHTQVATASAEAGRLRTRILRHEGKAIAGWYCFQLGGRVFTYQQGFDPEWENRSVARVLFYDLIEEACQDGIREIDMLRGGWEYKSHWTSHRRSLFNVNVYNDTPVGKLIEATDRGSVTVADAAKRALGRS